MGIFRSHGCDIDDYPMEDVVDSTGITRPTSIPCMNPLFHVCHAENGTRTMIVSAFYDVLIQDSNDQPQIGEEGLVVLFLKLSL